jgi:hypothetical protein
MSAIKNISLFVPHVYSNFTSAKVMEVFNGLHIGEVKSVDLVSKMGSDSKHYNAVYVHFTRWYDTDVAHDFQERLLDPTKEVKVMYDHPWYWIVLENKGKKHMSGDRKPTIDLDSFNTPEKPIVPVLNINKNKIKKPNSWVKQLPKPVNLEAAFEAEITNNGFTQEEIDMLVKEVELDNQRLMMPDISLSDHINALKYEVEAAHAQLDLTMSERNSFEERYIKEMAKNEALMEILKDIHNKK